MLLAVLLFLSFSAKASLSCFDLFSTNILLPKGYVLTEYAMNHIVYGELSGNLLKSGLHTQLGLQKLLKANPDLRSLNQLSPSIITGDSPLWFTQTTGTNGVVWLRLPKKIISRQGRKNLRSAQVQMQGAYLWKTLFPDSFGPSDISAAIAHVIENTNFQKKKNSQEALIYVTGEVPYTYFELPMTMHLTVIINMETKQVVSAFPAFTQNDTISSHGKTSIFPLSRSKMLDNSPYWGVVSEVEATLRHYIAAIGKRERTQTETAESLLSFFNNEAFAHPLDRIEGYFSLRNVNADVHRRYRKELRTALGENSVLSLGEKILVAKKTLYIIRNHGSSRDFLMMNIAIMDDVLWFARTQLSEKQLAEFHNFFIESPTYWYSFYPTILLKEYIQNGLSHELPTLLDILSRPEFFLFERGMKLSEKPHFSRSSLISDARQSDFINGAAMGYFHAVAGLKLNSDRPDLDFIQDRMNHLLLVNAAATYTGKNLPLDTPATLNERSSVWARGIYTQIVNEYGALAAEFDVDRSLDLNLSYTVYGGITVVLNSYALERVDGSLKIVSKPLIYSALAQHKGILGDLQNLIQSVLQGEQ